MIIASPGLIRQLNNLLVSDLPGREETPLGRSRIRGKALYQTCRVPKGAELSGDEQKKTKVSKLRKLKESRLSKLWARAIEKMGRFCTSRGVCHENVTFLSVIHFCLFFFPDRPR